jgi:hypothetical protein
MARRHSLFTKDFLGNLRQLVGLHHTVYPNLPPQGIFFEALVEQAFLRSGWKRNQVVATNPNQPQHDLTVGGTKISLKTETGKVAKRERISITKLCTTETGDWTSEALIQHTLRHLSRYDHILMMRAIWETQKFCYQALEIPLELLRRIIHIMVESSGRRTGRQSLSGFVIEGEDQIFQIRFDGADGKCQIKNLRLDRCLILAEWEHLIP